jgi:hypothetical protein
LGNLRLLLAMGGIALLGNGLKSVVTSTVLVSEARFASFLGIEVERVALLMESIVAGMVVALALYPLVVRRFAGAASRSLRHWRAPPRWPHSRQPRCGSSPRAARLWAYVCLTLGGAALIWLAPSAQSLVLGWPGAEGRKALTSIWTGATPGRLPRGAAAREMAAAGARPVRRTSHRSRSFRSRLPLSSQTTAIAAQRPDGDDALPVRLVVAFAAAVVTFEAWSTAGSVLGYTTAARSRRCRCSRQRGLVRQTRTTIRNVDIRHAVDGSPSPPCSRWNSTTGFFEAAFLYDRGLPEALVADRATLAAGRASRGDPRGGRRCCIGRISRRAWRGSRAASSCSVWAGMRRTLRCTTPGTTWRPRPVAGMGIGALTLVLCLAIIGDARQAVALAALPSIAIMVGTEVGLELLQCAFAAARGIAASPFPIVFAAQAAAAVAVVPLLRRALRHG